MVDAADVAADLQWLDDVVLDEGEVGVALEVGDVLALAGDEVVDADDLVALAEQQVGEVGAEEAGGAGDQDAQELNSLTRIHRPACGDTPAPRTRGRGAAAS